ncbi:MAG: hypothetical protein ABIQ38_00825 [Ilumatobacteraceae bacterium]
MTIRRFAEWGRLIDRPKTVKHCESDAQVASIAADYQSRGEPIPHIHVTNGSLALALGAASGLSSAQVRELPLDLLHISYRTADGIQHAATAANSVVMRRRLWIGEIVAVTNSGYWKSWEIAPRAHPNDGVFDVVEVSVDMSWRQRLLAWRRLPLGAHIPHSSVAIRRSGSDSWKFAKPIDLYMDEEFVGRATCVQITIEADALNILI